MVVETRAPSITVMDPRAEPVPTEASMAARPETLHGKVLGLLDNSKNNANELAKAIGDLLQERFEIKEIKVATKPDASRPAPAEIMEDLANGVDFAVVAVGD